MTPFLRRVATSLLVLGGLTAAAPSGVEERLDAPGPQPEGLASDGEHLWVADFLTGDIYRVDTVGGEPPAAFPGPGPHPEGLAWDGEFLWSADWETRQVYRLAVSDTGLTVVHEFPAPGAFRGAHPVGLTWDGSALWLTEWGQPYALYRLDPETGEVLRFLPIDPGQDGLYPNQQPRPEDLAWDGRDLWITDWFTKQIYRIDPDSLHLTGTFPSGGPRSVGLAFHRGALWNGDTGEGAAVPSLYRLDITAPTPVRRTTWGRLKARFRGRF